LQRGFDDAASRARVVFAQARELLMQPPELKLDTWLTLLQDRAYAGEKELAGALKEADWVRSPAAKTSAEARAKALAVSGLVWRNQGKYAEARAALKEAVKEAGTVKDAGGWAKQAASGLAEVTEANACYLPRKSRRESLMAR